MAWLTAFRSRENPKYSFIENWFSGKIENLAFPEEVRAKSE
jgi:hypothetical protein